MSIYEGTCDKLQPQLLRRKSKFSLQDAKNEIEDIKKTSSKICASGYDVAFSLAFGNKSKENNKNNFEEAVYSLRTKRIKGLKLESALEGIAIIYDFSFDEVKDFYEGKKYWMSIGHLYE